MLAQQQRDAALDAFDRLRVQSVSEHWGDSTASFLVRFQSTAASLGPEERIKLTVVYARESMELLEAVLADPHADKICTLRWQYDGENNANSIIPLLLNSCPELASLNVRFQHHCAFAFVSSMFEHPSSKVKVLEMPPNSKGDLARFFAALKQSQVSVLAIYNDGSLEFVQGLSEYLAKGVLVRLKVDMGNKQVPLKTMMSLTSCTCLVELEVISGEFSQPVAFPKSITKLVLYDCAFVGGFAWSFLAGSGVRVLDFYDVRGVDGNQLGSALAVHLKAKGLDEVRFLVCDFVNEVLAAAGLELGRIKRLYLDDQLDDASFERIALALQSPNSKMKELALEFKHDTASSIKHHLAPVFRHPNCNLAKLSFWTDLEHGDAAKTMEDRFYYCRALFALLQGQQVRRVYCPLRRLPVEMFRMVGEVLF